MTEWSDRMLELLRNGDQEQLERELEKKDQDLIVLEKKLFTSTTPAKG